ncbi:MAG TPA: glycosyltransferase family 4 protein [Bryobacteraceae bacterium]|jgi:glycosyltransferase involved in cell wall biosynthesis|nr:glycosyltransferase family 4 protein [Bryobacteraceae bacterium]
MGATAEKPIRVLLIAPSMDILGGQAVQAERLLSRLGQEPSLQMGFLPITPKLPLLLRFLQRIKYVRTAAAFVVYNSKLFWRAPRYDILHIFSAGLWSYTLWTIPALFASKLYSKKALVNYRDGQCEQHLREFRSAAPTLRMADMLVAPSGFLVDVFARHGLQARSIFNIMDFSRFQFRQRGKLRPVLMTNRILEPLYNVECILRAFVIIQERYPEASLTIAHDGPSRPGLEKMAGELKLRNTRFIGRVPHDQVPSLYGSAELYLTTPNIDCMPGSILECFASGVPVVATNTGGIPYIAENERTALLVDINDHEALAERVFRLLNDEKLVVRLTTDAREEVNRYQWSCVRDQWVAAYRELRDSNGSR